MTNNNNNKSINEMVLDIRNRQRIKPSSNDIPTASWKGKDLFNGDIVSTLTIIFKTDGCYWGKAGGCTMCGYVYDSAAESPDDSNLMNQLNKALEKLDENEDVIIKIFTSGSFLDPNEISLVSRKGILTTLGADQRIKKIIVETRPEFVTNSALEESLGYVGNKPFEIAIGLETSSDKIRLESINKGYTFNDFIQASEIAKKKGVTTKTYLLLKPPFISEGQAINDIVKSANDIVPYSETISINLCNVQKGTLVERLWENKEYRPPWLWSIVEAIKAIKSEHPDILVMSDPVGAGSERGPHNCKECSKTVANAIRTFSQTQDLRVLENLSCDCKLTWELVKQLDDLTYGSPITV